VLFIKRIVIYSLSTLTLQGVPNLCVFQECNYRNSGIPVKLLHSQSCSIVSKTNRKNEKWGGEKISEFRTGMSLSFTSGIQ
jgi:hypothetical protein